MMNIVVATAFFLSILSTIFSTKTTTTKQLDWLTTRAPTDSSYKVIIWNVISIFFHFIWFFHGIFFVCILRAWNGSNWEREKRVFFCSYCQNMAILRYLPSFNKTKFVHKHLSIKQKKWMDKWRKTNKQTQLHTHNHTHSHSHTHTYTGSQLFGLTVLTDRNTKDQLRGEWICARCWFCHFKKWFSKINANSFSKKLQNGYQ